jgi:hypothetical protein
MKKERIIRVQQKRKNDGRRLRPIRLLMTTAMRDPYSSYERHKAKLHRLPLSPGQYATGIRRIVDRLGV